MKKVFVIFIFLILSLCSCGLFDPKWIAAPVSITLENAYHWEPGPVKIMDPGTVNVTWVMDYSGNVFPEKGTVYYSLTDDIATASSSGPYAGGIAVIGGLGSGVTYYFWVIAYGHWAGATVYSQPCGSTFIVTN